MKADYNKVNIVLIVTVYRTNLIIHLLALEWLTNRNYLLRAEEHIYISCQSSLFLDLDSIRSSKLSNANRKTAFISFCILLENQHWKLLLDIIYYLLINLMKLYLVQQISGIVHYYDEISRYI